MAEPEQNGCLESMIRSFFGATVLVMGIILTVALFVHG